MFDKLEKLRKESENYRRRVALIISASIVGIIFLVWLSVLSVRFSASVQNVASVENSEFVFEEFQKEFSEILE